MTAIDELRSEIEVDCSRGDNGQVHSLVEFLDCADRARTRAQSDAWMIAEAVAGGREPRIEFVEGFRAARQLVSEYNLRGSEVQAKEERDRAAVDALGIKTGMRLRYRTLRGETAVAIVTHTGSPVGFAHLRKDDGTSDMVYLLHSPSSVEIVR